MAAARRASRAHHTQRLRVDKQAEASAGGAAQALDLNSACNSTSISTGHLAHCDRGVQRQQILSGQADCGISAEALKARRYAMSISLHDESLYGEKASLALLSQDTPEQRP